MIQEFYDTFWNVDVHDHYRQGSLEMERQWVTRNWVHRVFSTVLGVCIVDAYFAFAHERRINHDTPADFTYFCGRLSRELVENDLVMPRHTRAAKKTPTPEDLKVS